MKVRVFLPAFGCRRLGLTDAFLPAPSGCLLIPGPEGNHLGSSVAQSCLTLCDPMSVLSPQNFYVEAPAPTVTTFGGQTFKEVTKSK